MSNTSNSHRTLARLLMASPAIFGMFNAYAAEPQTAAPVADTAKPVEAVKPDAAKPAAAVKPAPVAAKDAPLQTVQVQGTVNGYDARRNDTATKIVVTQEEILKNGDTTIAEVLKRLPGVTVGGVQGRGGDIRMRGLGSGYTQVMLNGEPSPPGFSLDSLSPDMIERVEIMRSATAEYSTQAIAGAINIVLKKAIVTSQKELKIGAQVDDGYPGMNANFQLSDRSGALSYSIAGGLTAAKFERPSQAIENDTNAAGATTTLRTSEINNGGNFKGINLSPRVNWTLGPGDVITSQTFINANRFNGHATELVTTQTGTLPPFASVNTAIESNSTMLRTDLSWTRRLAAGAKLDMKGGVNYNKRDTNASSLEIGADKTKVVNQSVESGATDKGWTASGKYSTPIFEGHALVFGWDGAYSVRDEDRVQRETSATGTKPTAGGTKPVENLDQVYDANVARVAVFAQDEWAVTPRWSVYYGLRWEGINTRSDGNTYASIENKSSVWSPVFQTLWKLPDSKNDQVRLGLTRTYKAPGTGSLIPRRFTSANNTPTTPDSQGNPNLRPELAWGLDLAFEHYLPAGGLLSASTFVRRIEDITVQRVSQIDGLYVSMPTNDGVANTRGIELEAKLPLRSMFPTAPAIEMRANMTRSWSTLSTVPGPNNRLDQQTPFSSTVGADYKMADLPVTMGGSYSFQNGGQVRISEKQYAYSVPKRSLDIYGLWKFDAKNQLRVAVSNLLHQDNINQTTYVETFGGTQRTTITPTTAVIRAMMEMKF